MRRHYARCPRIGWYLSLASLAVISCGKSGPVFYPVKGSVFFEGKPAAGAIVAFHRVGETEKKDLPHAVACADGTFVISTFDRGDGAPAGRYQVTVIWRAKKVKNSGDDDGELLVPMRYLVPAQSGIEVEVKEGPTELAPFRLTK